MNRKEKHKLAVMGTIANIEKSLSDYFIDIAINYKDKDKKLNALRHKADNKIINNKKLYAKRMK